MQLTLLESLDYLSLKKDEINTLRQIYDQLEDNMRDVEIFYNANNIIKKQDIQRNMSRIYKKQYYAIVAWHDLCKRVSDSAEVTNSMIELLTEEVSGDRIDFEEYEKYAT